MTVTVYVDGWADGKNTKVREYVDVEHPGLDREYFLPDVERGFYHIDEESDRIYREVTVYDEEYPELNLLESNLKNIIESCGFYHKETTCDSISHEEMDRFHKALLINMNKASKVEGSVVSFGNFREFCPGDDYYKEKYEQILNIVKFARKKGAYIYWG